MSNQNITNLIDSIEIGDSIGLEQAFVAEMDVRLANKLDQFKQEVSQNLFKESVDEEFTDEELDAIVEDIDKLSLDQLEELFSIEEFSVLDEVSGALLGRYIQKARSDADKKFQHSRDLDSHPKVKAISDKIKGYYDAHSYTKAGKNVYHKSIEKERVNKEKTKKKLDPDYPKSTNGHKRLRNIEKAVKKLTTGKLTNND